MDLNTADAARAGRVVRDAGVIAVLMVLTLCVPYLIPVIVAWSLYRLYGWYNMNRRHSALRAPNSLPPHCELAVKFQSCRISLWIGALVWPIVFALYGMGLHR